MKKRVITMLVLILSALLLTACIGNDSDTSSDQSGEITTSSSEKADGSSSEGGDETESESDGSYKLPPMPIG